jgi:pimeloyl-ACP methyl ester carboxylesterase
VATFVIVHGAFGGGWEWAGVAAALRAVGHTVFTPTLTGMGERSHLGPRVGLGTHVQDVVGVLEFEDLWAVVLCGASYGGMAVTVAADRVPDRISLVVYVDALIPQHGQTGLDLLPSAFGDDVRSRADAHGHGWAAVPDVVLPPGGVISEKRRTHYIDRLRPQPIASFTEAVSLTGAIDRLPRAFLRCTAGSLAGVGDPIEPMAARAREEGWPYRELATPHDPQLFDPAGTASALHDFAANVAVRAHTADRDADPSP